MKINLNKNLIDIDGEVMPNVNAGKLLAQQLAQSAKGDPVKLWGWALKLNAGEELELDKSDFETLKSFVNNNENLFVISKAQILDLLGDFK
jgi:hypothetical protein